MNRELGTLSLEQLIVSPQPDFVRANVREQVFESARLSRISLLDSQATVEVAHAFEASPWVRRVLAVRKLPSHEIEVQLEYRRPVAMVFVKPALHSKASGAGYFAVDADSVLLPSNDFTEQVALSFLHILIEGAYPSTTAMNGTPFGDHRVLAASQLAGLLADHKQALGLLSIEWSQERNRSVLRVRRTDSSLVTWGSPIGSELPGEPRSDVKFKRLRQPGLVSDLDLRRSDLAEADLNVERSRRNR
jgi:hypothetical protein